jgi:hypothetical protein
MGALWAIAQDVGQSHWIRVRRISTGGVTSAVGLAVGQVAVRTGHASVVAVCLVLVAALAGAVSYSGTYGSIGGVQALLGVVVGSGFALPGPFWLPPVQLFLGTLLVLGCLLLSWVYQRHTAEMLAAARLFDAAHSVVASAGTVDADTAQRSLVTAANEAHRILSRYRRGTGARTRTTAANDVLRAYDISYELGAIATALASEGARVSPVLVNDCKKLRGQLNLPTTSQTRDGAAEVAGSAPPGGTPAVHALRSLVSDVHVGTPATFPGGRAVKAGVGWQIRAWSAGVLATCIFAAVMAAGWMHGSRAYWLPLAVAFIYKPELAPIPGRALHRCIGTILGAVLAITVASTGFSTYPSVFLVALCGVLLAVGHEIHYVVSTLALTTIAFVLVDFLGDSRNLLWDRILDTCIAAAIVFAAYVLVPPISWAHRARRAVTQAEAACARYVEESPFADDERQTLLRRDADSLTADARLAVGHAQKEWGRKGDWASALKLIESAERRNAATTARIVASQHSASL